MRYAISLYALGMGALALVICARADALEPNTAPLRLPQSTLRGVLPQSTLASLAAADPFAQPPRAKATTLCPCACGCDLGDPCKCGSSCKCGIACPGKPRAAAPKCACGCDATGWCDCDQCPLGKPAAQRNYYQLRKQAIAENKPLIVWVGQPVQRIEGCLACACTSFPGVGGKGIVVARPSGGDLWQVAALDGVPLLETVRLKAFPVQEKYRNQENTIYYAPSAFSFGGCVGGG